MPRGFGLRDPARQWERWGQIDPYYGVLSAEDARGGLDARARQQFFASGEEHLVWVETLLRRAGAQPENDRMALDFGCGVGRVLVPLAGRFQRVIGVDVSPSMLAECRRNIEGQLPDREVELISPAQMGALAGQSVDLVHSVIVLQHVPTRQGEAYLGELADLVGPGGVGAIHLTTRPGSAIGRAYFSAVKWVPGAAGAANIANRRPWAYPHMQMNTYRIDRATAILQSHGCVVHRTEPMKPAGLTDFEGAMLIFGRDASSLGD